MHNGLKSNGLLSTRIFTSCVVFLALITALPSFTSAQDRQVYYQDINQYLVANEEFDPEHDVAHWDNAEYWSQNVAPSQTCNSIFVVGNRFHLRAHNGSSYTDQVFGTSDSTKPNYLYVGYEVDLETGTVNLNKCDFAALHLKGKNWGNDSITIDQLYLGNGELFQGAAGSTITLHGNITIEGNAAFRNVAEAHMSAGQTEDRILIIESRIHGTGTLNIEAEKTHGDHQSEIFIASTNNDFSGSVCINSGTHIYIDDEQHEHPYYDYQTHLFLTGENALYNASMILNEGIVKITADQTFQNYYSGVDTHQSDVFTGIGSLTIDNGANPVEVKLYYDDPTTINNPLGQITANDKSTLEFELPAGKTKSMTMSENDDNYSKIDSQGKLVKSGDGTLQIVAASEGLIGAESFVISSGRLDMEGYFTGDVVVGEKLPDPATGYTTGTFSPGDVVGAVANVIGDFDVHDGSTLAFEQDATGMDLLKATNFDVSPSTIFDLTMGSYEPGAVYPILVQNSGEFTDTYARSSFWDSLLSPASQPYWTLFVSGDTVYAKIKDDAPVPPYMLVPEPSTWVLLIIGAAGLLYVRKRK
ncbi:MAG: PEP-CTERM sorting domain-containing protein [Thermoguttaceae bacterium]|nr:PEP-CTERM sorting domain-containing protein [Thermoguttaceae bacterium]